MPLEVALDLEAVLCRVLVVVLGRLVPAVFRLRGEALRALLRRAGFLPVVDLERVLVDVRPAFRVLVDLRAVELDGRRVERLA